MLPGWGVRECDWVPFLDILGLPRGNVCDGLGVALLKRGIAPAVIAVQVCVEQQIKGLCTKGLLNKGAGLSAVGPIPCIDEGRRPVPLDQDVVG